MIERLTGTLAEKSPAQLLIDVNGVRYEVDVPMSSFHNLPGIGQCVTLLTHLVVCEDVQVLFGFLTHDERATFRLLVKISGVEPRTALLILSGLSADELAQVVAQTPPQERPQNMPHVALTDRENEVLLRVGKGYTLPEIGIHLNLSRHTIADHVKQINHKLNVSSRAEAVLEAQRLGLFRR